jgi:HAD superfamily hydrolase (TIGR01549 family)
VAIESIDTLFLDAGGVLVFPNWQRVADTLGRHGVMADGDVLAQMEPHVKRAMDVPDMERLASDRQRGWRYFDEVLTRAGIAPDDRTRAALEEVDRYNAEWNVWEYLPPYVVPALERFRALGLRQVVVSNSNGILDRLFTRLGLTAQVDLLLDSTNFGVEKPDPRLFQIALDRAGASADRTVHVGDLYNIDIVGARAAGIRAVLVDVAGLYPDVDCPRVESVAMLADRIEAEGWAFLR